MNSGLVERHVAGGEPLRVRQQHRRPALQRHIAVRDRALQRQRRGHPVQVCGIGRQLVGVDEAQVVVAVWNLRCATGIDDVDLGGDLVARAQPSLRDQGQRVVGVVVGEHLRGVQGELLRGVPDPVVGAGLAEVVTGRGALGALRVDQFGERGAGRVDARRRRRLPRTPRRRDRPSARGSVRPARARRAASASAAAE